MPNTPNRGYPYPASGDRAVVHKDIQEPLEWVDADVQNLVDEVGERVRGVGATTLWVGTYTEYDALGVYDPDTVYVIRGGERNNPGKRWGLGVPVISRPPAETNSVINPTLPALSDEWGYLAIIAGQNPVPGTWWNAPDGWTRLADQADVDGGASMRPVGIFKAPAGTPGGLFYVPGHGQGRMIAAVFPINLEPTNEGFIAGTAPIASPTFTIPGSTFLNPAGPITIALGYHSNLAPANLPTVPAADYDLASPEELVSGGNYNVMHLIIDDTPVSYKGEEEHTVSRTPDGMWSAYRIGIGSM